MSKELGKRIKSRRLELGLTQEELRKKIGLQSRSSVCMIEKGAISIPLNDIDKWSKALGMNPMQLMGYDEKPADAANFAADILLDTEVMKMLKDYYSLTKEQQSSIRALIASMKK